jgi:hypothetical protein
MNENYFISRSYDDLLNMYLLLNTSHSQNVHNIYTLVDEITLLLEPKVHNKDIITYYNLIRDSAYPARDYDKMDGKNGERIGFWARSILQWKKPKLVIHKYSFLDMSRTILLSGLSLPFIPIPYIYNKFF